MLHSSMTRCILAKVTKYFTVSVRPFQRKTSYFQSTMYSIDDIVDKSRVVAIKHKVEKSILDQQ